MVIVQPEKESKLPLHDLSPDKVWNIYSSFYSLFCYFSLFFTLTPRCKRHCSSWTGYQLNSSKYSPYHMSSSFSPLPGQQSAGGPSIWGYESGLAQGFLLFLWVWAPGKKLIYKNMQLTSLYSLNNNGNINTNNNNSYFYSFFCCRSKADLQLHKKRSWPTQKSEEALHCVTFLLHSRVPVLKNFLELQIYH